MSAASEAQGFIYMHGFDCNFKKKRQGAERVGANLESLSPPHDTEEHFIKGSILLEWVDLNSQIKKTLFTSDYFYIFLYISIYIERGTINNFLDESKSVIKSLAPCGKSTVA